MVNIGSAETSGNTLSPQGSSSLVRPIYGTGSDNHPTCSSGTPTPEHTPLDYAAVMSSAEHIRQTLQWGNWLPPDMTEDGNRAALQNHWAEFKNRKAYAYTVLSPDKDSCLGCVYLYPASSSDTGLSMIF